MISDFEIQKRHNDVLNKRRNVWKVKNDKYNLKLEKIKENNDKLREKSTELDKKLKLKEQNILNAQGELLKTKDILKQKSLKFLASREKAAKKHVDEYQRKLESQRLQYEKITEDKSISFYLYLLLYYHF